MRITRCDHCRRVRFIDTSNPRSLWLCRACRLRRLEMLLGVRK